MNDLAKYSAGGDVSFAENGHHHSQSSVTYSSAARRPLPVVQGLITMTRTPNTPANVRRAAAALAREIAYAANYDLLDDNDVPIINADAVYETLFAGDP